MSRDQLIEIQFKKFIEGRLVDNEWGEKTKASLQQRAKNNGAPCRSKLFGVQMQILKNCHTFAVPAKGLLEQDHASLSHGDAAT
jgi:hypothetical protein